MTKPVQPLGSQDVAVDITRGPHATIAHARLTSDQTFKLVGVGDSKRAPGDKSESAIGDALAVARALRDLADQVLDMANAASERLNPTKPEPAPKREVYLVSDAILNPLAGLSPPSMSLFADRREPVETNWFSKFAAAFAQPRPSNVGKITGD
jgi:hypothetical protein